MRKSVLLSVAVAAVLAACGDRAVEPAPPAQNEADDQSLVLSCARFAGATAESLAREFGAENVVNAMLPGPEGTTYEGTTIFPNDDARRLEVSWHDEAARTQIATVTSGSTASRWIGPHGLATGQTLAHVQQINGRAFTLWGFGWDYAGTVSDWNGGAFDAEPCRIQASFDARGDMTGVAGDSEFSSEAPGMSMADPAVTIIGLGFAAD